jgi:NADH-quinone oxidoreductase subunit J
MNGMFEWVIFLALSAIAIFTAAGMILTMSMYRAGLALMASFVALAGLFILLNADLLAAIQIMMNVGGMLVMVLFMVMIMMDPGGEMMWSMKRNMHIRGLGAFSMSMPRGKPSEGEAPGEKEQQEATPVSDWTCPMHPEIRQDQPGKCPKCGMNLVPAEDAAQEQESHEQHRMSMEHADSSSHPTHMEQAGNADGAQMSSHDMNMHMQSMDMHTMSGGGHDMHMSGHNMNMRAGMTPRQYYDMMVGMGMSTAQLPWAIVLGAVAAILLIILVIQTPWPLAPGGPTQDATTMVGELLLSRYMIGFEGAAFLILAGIAGAVILGKRERKTADQPSAKQAGTEETDQQVYTCPMHPEVRQNQPGNCPKCGMTLMSAQETPAARGQSRQGEHA